MDNEMESISLLVIKTKNAFNWYVNLMQIMWPRRNNCGSEGSVIFDSMMFRSIKEAMVLLRRN